MISLKSKQFLIKAAKLSQKNLVSDPKREIQKTLNKIKYASQKSSPKPYLAEEVIKLERMMHNFFLLEKKVSKKEKEQNKKIDLLQKQIKTLKQKNTLSQNPSIKRKLEKLSHTLGNLMAKEETKKEVAFENIKKELERKHFSPKEISLTKIKRLQLKIQELKNNQDYPKEKITILENRLTELEKKLKPYFSGDIPDNPPIKHKMLFGSQDLPPKKE